MRNPLMWIAAIATAILVGSAAQAQEVKSTYDIVKERGVLNAGLRNDYPPAGFVDKDGQWVGFDIDVAQYIADTLGVRLERVNVTSKTRVPLLINGNVDIVIATFGPTTERAQVVEFAGPYFIASMKVLTKKGSGIATTDDLAAPRKTGMVQGSADGPRLQRIQPNVELVYFQEWPLAALALKQGSVDAIYTADVTLGMIAKDDPTLEIVGRDDALDPFMLGLRQNDSKWRLFLEETIQRGWADGTLKAIYAKYLPDVTFELLLWPEFTQN